MRKLLLLTAIIQFCISYVFAQTKKPASFEGIVTYKVIYTSKTNNTAYDAYIRQKYGTVLKKYISKQGNIKQEYPQSGEKGVQFFIYNASSNRMFARWKNIDTIFSSDCGTNSLKFISEKDLPDENIHGVKCKGFTISAIESKTGQPILLTCFYPPGKKDVDPELYKHFRDFFNDRMVTRMHTIFYRFTMETSKYARTLEIDHITPTTLDNRIFNLPATLPVKSE